MVHPVAAPLDIFEQFLNLRRGELVDLARNDVEGHLDRHQRRAQLVRHHLDQLAFGIFDFALDFLGCEGVALQPRHDRRHQFGSRKGLGQVVIRAQFHAVTHKCPVGAGGEKNKRDGRYFRCLPHFHEHRIAIHFRHRNIAHDQVGQEISGGLDAFLTIGRQQHLEAFVAQNLRNVLTYGLFVLNHQNLGHRSAPLVAPQRPVPVS